MPYGERMLFLIGAGVMLIGAGWFLLVRWPAIYEASTVPSAVSVESPSPEPELIPPEIVQEAPSDLEPLPTENETPPVEGSVDVIQDVAPPVPDIEPIVPPQLPEPEAVVQEPLVEEPEVTLGDEREQTESLVEYPLPPESIRPVASERDAPIQMVITRDRPLPVAEESPDVAVE